MRGIIAFLLSTISIFGQDLALARLKQEMVAARAQIELDLREKHPAKNGGAAIAAVHEALRDWIESHLPQNLNLLAGQFSQLGISLSGELRDAGLGPVGSSNAHSFDSIFKQVGLELTIMPELPDTLFVTAAVEVGCGADQAVYVYRFDGDGRTRVIENHPKSDWGYGNAKFVLSDPDSQGRRLLLVHRWNIQCGSSWMGMPYSVYRLNPAKPVELLLSSEHGFWRGNEDDGRLFVLKPDELIIELLDLSVDTTVHNRTHILRYSFSDVVKRIEPMALQPQDFAEEWLTRPWSEIQSRSAPKTQKSHERLHAALAMGEYTNVILCAAKPDRWSIGFEIGLIGDKKLKDPIEVHLLVRDLGNYRFEMEAVSDSEFEGCPGEGSPSDKHPWLSVEQLKALP